METLQTVGSLLGIGLLSGYRLYATVLALGLGIRFDIWRLSTHLHDLAVLADTKVLVVAGAACLLEFVADKVPWVDSIWDSFHTVIRPVGAIALATTALGEMDPVNKTILSLLCGTVALAGHSSKAATRFVANHSPEPFSNWGLSLVEDVAAPLGLWFVLAHPIWALAILAIFMAVFCWLSPKLFRLLRLQWSAMAAAVGQWFDTRPARSIPVPASVVTSDATLLLWNRLSDRMDEISPGHASALSAKLGVAAPRVGVRCAATKSVDGLRGSIGYLCVVEDRIAFVTRRWFGWRTRAVALSDVKRVEWQDGWLLDQLAVHTGEGTLNFELFKVARSREQEAGYAAAPLGKLAR